MFEKFTAAGASDFRQRYLNTYGYFTARGKKSLVKLSKIDVEARERYVEFVDRDNDIFKVVADAQEADIGFHFLPPKSSWYNRANGIPILIQRVATKQYLRGICDRNTTVLDIRGKAYPVDFTTLISIFEDKVTPKEMVDHALKSPDAARGIAISPQFVVGIATESIKVFNHTIGNSIYKDGKFVVTLLDKATWGTEVVDAFKRANITLELK